jgi:hypothetical protein
MAAYRTRFKKWLQELFSLLAANHAAKIPEIALSHEAIALFASILSPRGCKQINPVVCQSLRDAHFVREKLKQ